MAKKQIQSLKWVGEVCTITYPMIGKSLVCDTSKYNEPVRAHARQHGFHQRFGDAESGDKTGAAKFEAVKAIDSQYRLPDGDWDMKGERDTTTEVIEAVHRVMPKYSVSQLEAAVKADPEQVADWRQDAQVKLELAKARAKRAAENAKAAPKQELVIKGL